NGLRTIPASSQAGFQNVIKILPIVDSGSPQLTGVERNAHEETKHERTDIPILAEPEVVPLPNRDLGRLSRDRNGFRTAACQTGASIRRFEGRDHRGRSDRAFRVCW